MGRFGQKFRRSEAHLKTPHLHVGCGEVLIPGAINTDVFWNRRADFGIDLRFPLPFPDQTFQSVYAHHVVEHLEYADALSLFREVFRILQPGGVFRVVVPDVSKFIMAYAGSPLESNAVAELYPSWFRDPEWRTAMEVVDRVVRDSYFNPHRSCWDFPTMETRLAQAGFSFSEVSRCGVSLCPFLVGRDAESWASHSLYVEAVR